MTDVALASEGAVALAPTSHDPAHGAECILNEDDGQFWMTTGLFPQEVIVKLGDESNLDRVEVRCGNVQRMELQGSRDASVPSDWSALAELDLPETDGRLQVHSAQVERGAGERINFVKIRILSGWDDFASIHKVGLFT